MKLQTSATLFVALSLVSLATCFNLPVLADDKVDGPSVEDLQKSKERGLFIEQPSYVRKAVNKATKVEASVEPTKQPAKTIETKTAAATSKAPVKVSTTQAKPKVAATKASSKVASHKGTIAKPKPVHHTVNIIESQVAKNEPPADIQTVAYDADAIIDAWLNKTGKTPRYKDGEKMEINVKAHRDCNVTIYDYDGKGKLTQIFPNNYQQSSLVKSGQTVSIGGAESEFEYQLSVTPGQKKVNESIFVFAYPVAEAPLSIAMNTSTNSPFRSADMTPEAYRKLVNESKVFFARDVKILPKNKSSVKTIAADTGAAPNKIELSLTIEK